MRQKLLMKNLCSGRQFVKERIEAEDLNKCLPITVRGRRYALGIILIYTYIYIGKCGKCGIYMVIIHMFLFSFFFSCNHYDYEKGDVG